MVPITCNEPMVPFRMRNQRPGSTPWGRYFFFRGWDMSEPPYMHPWSYTRYPQLPALLLQVVHSSLFLLQSILGWTFGKLHIALYSNPNSTIFFFLALVALVVGCGNVVLQSLFWLELKVRAFGTFFLSLFSPTRTFFCKLSNVVPVVTYFVIIFHQIINTISQFVFEFPSRARSTTVLKMIVMLICRT